MSEAQRNTYNEWRATAAVKLSQPRQTVIIRPMSVHAYAAALAARALHGSR